MGDQEKNRRNSGRWGKKRGRKSYKEELEMGGGGGYKGERDSRNWEEGSGRMEEKEMKEKDEQVEEGRALE